MAEIKLIRGNDQNEIDLYFLIGGSYYLILSEDHYDINLGRYTSKDMFNRIVEDQQTL